MGDRKASTQAPLVSPFAASCSKGFESLAESSPQPVRQIPHCLCVCCCSVAKLCSPLCDSMDWLHGLQHIRLLCPSLSPWVCSNSCSLSQSVTPFSFCLQSFPAAGSFPMNQLFISVGQSIKALASVSVLPMDIQGWFPLGLTGLISLQSQGLSRVFSSTTIWKHQFFSLLYDSTSWPTSWRSANWSLGGPVICPGSHSNRAGGRAGRGCGEAGETLSPVPVRWEQSLSS